MKGLKQARKAKGMSVTELADKLDTTTLRIINAELGDGTLTLKQTKRAAEILNTSIDFIIYGCRENGKREKRTNRLIGRCVNGEALIYCKETGDYVPLAPLANMQYTDNTPILVEHLQTFLI